MDQSEKAVSENEAVELGLESLENTSGGCHLTIPLWNCPLCDFSCLADEYVNIAIHRGTHDQE